MPKIPDLPPTSNTSAPSFDQRLARQIEGLGSIDGLPFFRIVFGQDKEATKTFWRGEYHFKYKHHAQSKLMQAEAAYDLEGKFIGYKRFFDIDSIIPVGIIRDTVLKVKEFGVPRFYIEMLTYHDIEVWDSERYTNEYGEPEYDANHNLIDFTGSYPPFGLEYDCLWLIAYHDECCVSRMSNNLGVREDGSRCYGFRRLPQQQDVDMVMRRFRAFQDALGNKDLKAEVSNTEMKVLAKNRLNAMKDYWEAIEEKIWDDTHQMLIPHSKRLITESGQAADQQKYHFQNMPTTTRDTGWYQAKADKEKLVTEK